MKAALLLLVVCPALGASPAAASSPYGWTWGLEGTAPSDRGAPPPRLASIRVRIASAQETMLREERAIAAAARELAGRLDRYILPDRRARMVGFESAESAERQVLRLSVEELRIAEEKAAQRSTTVALTGPLARIRRARAAMSEQARVLADLRRLEAAAEGR